MSLSELFTEQSFVLELFGLVAELNGALVLPLWQDQRPASQWFRKIVRALLRVIDDFPRSV
jgi:hypothetical protein